MEHCEARLAFYITATWYHSAIVSAAYKRSGLLRRRTEQDWKVA